MVTEYRIRACSAVVFALAATFGGSARAGSHTWDVNEVFSNADGTIQFIELWEANGSPGEVGVPGHMMTSDAKSFTISGAALSSPTTNKFYLIATQTFADLPGAPTPDAIIPVGVVPFFSVDGDTITYEPWDGMTFGAGVLPTDGLNSLRADLTTGLNSPTNYAGIPGSVDASEAGPVPAASTWGVVVMSLVVACAGTMLVVRRRAVAV